MAYNSVRERDPLIDKETRRALERRLTEFLGIVMIACAALFFTYNFYVFSDRSWSSFLLLTYLFKNLLGNTGAAIASPSPRSCRAFRSASASITVTFASMFALITSACS